MIVDRIEDYIRGNYTPTPEQFALADAMSEERGRREREMFNGFFVDMGLDDEERPGVSGSSPFWCYRRLQYGETKVAKEPPAPRALLAWYMGRGVESMVQRLIVLTQTNVVWPKLIDGKLVEKEVTLDTPYGPVSGHVDLVMDIKDQEIPVEIKSSATFGWKKIRGTRTVDDLFGHYTQLQFYIHAMKAPGGIYVSVAKETGHSCEVHLDKDNETLREIMTACARLKTNLEAGSIAPHHDWALKTKRTKEFPGYEQLASIRCGYCAWTAGCHNGVARTTNARKQPVWLRKIEEEATK